MAAAIAIGGLATYLFVLAPVLKDPAAQETAKAESEAEEVPKEPVAVDLPSTVVNVMREDVVGEPLTAEEALSGAPDAEDGQFKVPAILEED